MNAAIHANISAKKWETNDKSDWDHFYKLHDFMDWSKEVIADNRQRLLSHHLWYVKRAAIPIFGHSYQLKGINKIYNTKDDMESSHIVADFHGKFLPSLSDYFDLVEDSPDDEQRFKDFREDNKGLFAEYPNLEELFLSPLYATGWVKSLWMTHNSWFLGTILPLIPEYGKIAREIRSYRENSPTILFNRMRYEDWVQNGNGCPPSYAKVFEHREKKRAVRNIPVELKIKADR